MKINKINFFNKETKEIQEGLLCYEVDMNYAKVKIECCNIIAQAKTKNALEALGKIRKIIYPWEPMIIGTQKNIFPYRKFQSIKYFHNLKLGERYNRDKLVSIFQPTSNIDFAPLEFQKAFIELYQKSFATNINQEYNIPDKYIAFEKIPKYLYLPDKQFNPKPYKFFYLYDKKNNKVYDITSKNDIIKLNNNKLMYKWKSLDDFLKYYATKKED